MIPDYTASLETNTKGAHKDGTYEPEHEVRTGTGFAQCMRSGAKDYGTLPMIGAAEQLNSLGKPHGTVTFVDSWSNSYVNCTREIPEVERIYGKYGEAGLVVTGVYPPQQAHEREVSVVSSTASHLGITYPVALDPELETFKAYGANAQSTHYLAESDGQLRLMGRGTSGLEGQIRILLTEAGASLSN